MSRPIFLIAATALLLSQATLAETPGPERTVRGTTLTSTRDPAITIELPAEAQYLGADRWELYDACDAELHVFVEAGPDKRVRRLYWVQFEQYLPNNTYTYDYTFQEKLTHAGLTFDVSPNYRRTTRTSRPGSDREHVIAMLTKHGYALPPETMSVRLVNLLDDSRRKELMFIYIEDLALSGTTVWDLEKGKSSSKWATLKQELTRRALDRIELVVP
jgi:hypothetical protein